MSYISYVDTRRRRWKKPLKISHLLSGLGTSKGLRKAAGPRKTSRIEWSPRGSTLGLQRMLHRVFRSTFFLGSSC